MIDVYEIANLIKSRRVLHNCRVEGYPVWRGYESKDYEYEFVGDSKGEIFAFRYWSKNPDQFGARRKTMIRLVYTWTKLIIQHHFMTGYNDIAMEMADEYKNLYSTTVNEYWYSEEVKASKTFKFWEKEEQREINLSYLASEIVLDDATEDDFEKSTYYGVHICDLGFTPNKRR